SEVPAYSKTFTFSPSRLRIGAHAPGFATTASPVVNLSEGDEDRTIELILRRGATATLRIVDGQNRGIPGAEVRAHDHLAMSGSSTGSESRTVRADDQGVVQLDRISDGDYALEVRVPGFQRDQRIGPLATDAPVEWPLKPARRTPVKVVEAATG